MRVIVIDNYDSFVFNLVQCLGELGAENIVRRNDQITLREIGDLKPDKIVLSPGPGSPQEPRYFGICKEILQNTSHEVPTLGVCLGHQGIIHTFGGKVISSKKLMHGKTSRIKHDGEGIFTGVRNPFTATRYHSLAGEKSSIPSCLKISAEAVDDGEIMAVRHAKYPIYGVQFHPESILCEDGILILRNFLEDT